MMKKEGTRVIGSHRNDFVPLGPHPFFVLIRGVLFSRTYPDEIRIIGKLTRVCGWKVYPTPSGTTLLPPLPKLRVPPSGRI